MGRFVVKPSEAGGPAEPIAGVEPLADTGLFVGEAQDPRAVVAQSDAIAWGAPTVGDDRAESFPTGEVTVRFVEAPAAESLASFIEQHGLELCRRNEFTPEQIVFAPRSPVAAWLPDLVERLNRDAGVVRAWPNTLSQYHRGR